MGETLTVSHRLSKEAYDQLCKELPGKGLPVMTKDPLECATLLGMQIVLQKLRDGFVVGA